MKINFYDLMRAAHVKRWHVVNCAREQTLAEHHWLVSVIALELYQRMVGVDNVEQAPEVLQLVCGAMFHDVTEIRTGDPPSPAKDLYKKFGGNNLFTAINQALMPETPYIGGNPAQNISHFIKMADLIEAAWFIHENGVGTHAGMVSKGAWRSMVEYVRRLEAETGVDWHEDVNHVLQCLGMPYIYKEAMESAP